MKMRIAVVMPRHSRMDSDRLNSMEAVALSLNTVSRFRDDLRIICDAGASRPALSDLLTVPEGLGRADRSRAVLECLKDFAPDHVEYHQQLGQAAEMARRLRGPVQVLYRHTRIEPPNHLIARLRRHHRLAAFDQLVFVSQAASRQFGQDYPRFRALASAVCNPIDAQAWQGDVQVKERLIVFSGRALPEKGLDLFCQALSLALDAHPSWRGALLLGDWERHRAWAQPQIAGLDRFGDRVEIHRSAGVSQVMDVLRRAAIAVTPSRIAEAFGLAALEAHAAGAALVSSGRGGLREVSGDHAIYVDPPDVSGLATAIDHLIRDPAARQTLARNAQALARVTHGTAQRAKELDELRQALADRHRRSPRAHRLGHGPAWSLATAPVGRSSHG